MTVAFAAIFDIDAKNRFNRLGTGSEGVIADAGETDLVGRRFTRLRSADPVPGIAKVAHDAHGARVLRARQASAEQAVILMHVAVAGSMQYSHEAVLGQMAIMFPFTGDTRAIRREG